MTGFFVFALALFVPSPTSGALTADDVVGGWFWATPATTTGANGLPSGTWSGTLAFSEDTSGKLTGTMLDSVKLDNISVSGNSIQFDRVIGNPDEDGLTIQVWKGSIEERGGTLHMRGKWTGAFESIPNGMGVTTDFVAVKTS